MEDEPKLKVVHHPDDVDIAEVIRRRLPQSAETLSNRFVEPGRLYVINPEHLFVDPRFMPESLADRLGDRMPWFGRNHDRCDDCNTIVEVPHICPRRWLTGGP